MTLKVGELEEHLAKRKEGSRIGKLGDFTVSDDASLLHHGDGLDKHQWVLDTSAAHAFAKYLKIPTSYYDKADPDFRATLLRYEIDRHKEAGTVIETLNDEIVAVHQPEVLMLPLGRVAKVVEKSFAPEDTIRRMVVNDARFHVDVTSATHQVNVAPLTEVGDITEAGVRFLAYPFRGTQPSVGVYAERLVCMNGQTTDERVGRISLSGRTVDEVILEMEEAANLVLGQLDDYLGRLNATTTMYPPGSPQAFAAQLAREAKVKREVLDKVLDIINQLPEPVSVYDVNQAFTTVANEVETYATMTRLQALGGSLAFSAEKMIERCKACERLL